MLKTIIGTEVHHEIPHIKTQAEIRTPLKLDDEGNPYFVVQARPTNKLLSIALVFQNDLDSHHVSSELKQELKNKHISLSQNIIISTIEENSRWLINDKDNNQRYPVKKRANQLEIYADTITCIPDPLGINGETHIGERRALRPKPDDTYTPKPPTDGNTVKAMFPFLLQPENEWFLNAIIERTNNAELLQWIDQQLNEERFKNLKQKLRLNAAIPPELCGFCRIKPLAEVNDVFSVNNLAPFGAPVHRVLILSEPKHYVSEITVNDICGLYNELYGIAKESQEEFEDLDGLNYGSNLGEYQRSGASQPHLHSQVTALGAASFNVGDRLGLMCKAYQATYNREDYLGDYIQALEQANLVLAQNEHAILYVPIAQRFNREVQIMVKAPKVGNILNTTSEIRQSIAELEYKAFRAYQCVNLHSFNTVMYATRFSEKNDYKQRLIVSIYPRTAIFAFSELTQHYVIDELPWDSAEKMRSVIET